RIIGAERGRLFVYRANYAFLDREHVGIWTAVCEPPSFRSVVRWDRMASWGGGGLFADDGTLELGDVAAAAIPSVPDDLRVVGNGYRDPDAVRLQRAGFVVDRPWHEKDDVDWSEVWRKPVHDGAMFELTRGSTRRDWYTRYALVRADGTRVELDGVMWADVDHDGRIIGAERGRLFVADTDTLSSFEVVADLNEMTPPA
ncbi:MAG TPA: hypothetical protein VEA78_11460, partial [Acidimicrobiales bacterium]|nr:hypothetical protein [Acidimicrobiales bacterium]